MAFVRYNSPSAAAMFGLVPARVALAGLPARRPALNEIAAVMGARRRMMGRGLAGVLEDAQTLLTAAGYQGASCRTEQVNCPQCPGGYYQQDICSAPGYPEGFEAQAVINSTLAHPGYGVDLSAERKQLGYNASDPSYFEWLGNNSNTKVVAQSSPSIASQYQSLLKTGPIGGGGASATAPVPVSVTLTTQRGGSDYRTTDTFILKVTGKPSSPVTVTTTQNGQPVHSNVTIGSTDANGNFILTGPWDSSNAGSWVETWSVGGQSQTIRFTVAGPATTSSGASSSGSSASGSAGAGSNGGGSSSSGGAAGSDLFSGAVNVMGLSIPVWALGLATVGGLYALGGRR